MSAATDISCANCSKTKKDVGRPLLFCAACSHSTAYCNRDCQKAHWKTHKTSCPLEKKIDKPFTRLDKKAWLHDRPEKDVYKLLIDSYRLSLEDDYMFDGDIPTDSLYAGSPDSLKDFRRFVRKAEKRKGLLPSWWSPEKRKACEDFGMADTCWHSLKTTVEKKDIVDKYNSQLMPMQMRMFREQATGKGPMGQDSTMMRQVQMAAEAAEGSPGSSTMDISQATTVPRWL